MKFDIVIPVYNEELCINETVSRLEKVKSSLENRFEVNLIFVNDGSSDKTLDLLSDHAENKNYIHIIDLSRNFGHQIALTAGLDYTNADIVGIIDGDLQDPPELFPQMIDELLPEYDVIYGQRKIRVGETKFKLLSAKLFYLLLSRMCDVPIPRDTGDFRLINSKVLISLKQMREKHRFVRGLVPFAGFKQKAFFYSRQERFAGTTKYPLKRMIRFALDAIFSFSTKPLKLIRYFGLLTFILSAVLVLNTLWIRFYGGAVPGYSSTVIIIVFFSSVQILSISILGEYIGRIFEQSKDRPLYFINKIIKK